MKQLGILLASLSIWGAILILSCGSIDDNTPDVEQPQPSPAPSVVIKENPICEGDLLSFGPKSTNLWKPNSDTIWGFAFVIDERFVAEFTQCHVELKDGSYHELECFKNNGTCFANGNRQHWKTKLKVENVKAKATIICQEAKQECRWQLPGRATQRWE